MMDYGNLAARLQAGTFDYRTDSGLVLGLIGYEVAPHGRLGMACRKVGDSHWQSLPDFNSANDAELWLCGDRGYSFDDIGREQDGRWFVSMYHATHGNDYGYGQRLGTAMWAAFIRVAGKA